MNTNTSTETKTQVLTDQGWEGNFKEIKDNSDDRPVEVDIPVFLIFAEFLGYKSRFLSLAEKWCNGEFPEVYIQQIMRIEALAILRHMKEKYGCEDIRYWFFTYYRPLLKEHEEKLESFIEA